jgi:hypothetical protein
VVLVRAGETAGWRRLSLLISLRSMRITRRIPVGVGFGDLPGGQLMMRPSLSRRSWIC